MKKAILTLALAILVLSTYAQSFDLGIKGGFNSTKITTDKPLQALEDYTFDDFKSDVSGGFNVGAFARIGGRVIYLQPELLYSLRKGETAINYNDGDGGGNITVNQKIKLKSIQIPVLVGFKLLDLKLASVRAFTGPAMSIVLDDSESIFDMDNTGFQPAEFKNNIWDWQLGAGVDLLNFTFDVRYAWGLTDFTEGNLDFVNKGNTLTFSVGFKIF